MKKSIKKLFRQNILFTIIILGAFAHRHYQNTNTAKIAKNRNLSNISVYSMERKSEIKLKDLTFHDKTIYLWATWCPPCRIQNQIIDLYETLGIIDNDKLIKISVDQNKQALKKYLKDEKQENHFIETTNLFFNERIIRGTPSMIKVDQDGFVEEVKTGINLLW